MGRKTMTKAEREQNRAYVKNWERVGPLLERIRVEELRSPDYGKNWRAWDSLLGLGSMNRRLRPTSGLVEMQRILAKAQR